MPDAMSHDLDGEYAIDVLVSGWMYDTIHGMETKFTEFVFTINMWWVEWTARFPVIIRAIQTATDFLTGGLSMFVYTHREPTRVPWISISEIDTDLVNNPWLSEKYVVWEEGLSEKEMYARVANETPDGLITMYTGDRYLVSFSDHRMPSGEPSNVEFILIEYHHRNLTAPLTIQLPSSMYRVGNEILSKTFVYRHLEYLPIYWSCKFDGSYVIRIVDHNADPVLVHPDEYVVLDKDGYRIVNPNRVVEFEKLDSGVGEKLDSGSDDLEELDMEKLDSGSDDVEELDMERLDSEVGERLDSGSDDLEELDMERMDYVSGSDSENDSLPDLIPIDDFDKIEEFEKEKQD